MEKCGSMMDVNTKMAEKFIKNFKIANEVAMPSFGLSFVNIDTGIKRMEREKV